jgi:HD-GYP domain-containing protein (c-di-GMP phosphodiesterase class II)
MKNGQADTVAIDALLATLDESALARVKSADNSLESNVNIPPWNADVTGDFSSNLGAMIAQVIDYKSKFTRMHSTGLAQKAVALARSLGADKEELSEIYLAASLHDLGKITTPMAILEKPGRLDKDEMAIMREHVRVTWQWIKDVPGLGKIAYWAANHHEKLDGSGYPFGKTAIELDRNARLMAVADMYQGISEARPYHAGRSHADTMNILRDEARKGRIDADIVEAAGELFGDEQQT